MATKLMFRFTVSYLRQGGIRVVLKMNGFEIDRAQMITPIEVTTILDQWIAAHSMPTWKRADYVAALDSCLAKSTQAALEGQVSVRAVPLRSSDRIVGGRRCSEPPSA